MIGTHGTKVDYPLLDWLRSSLPASWGVITGLTDEDGRDTGIDILVVGENEVFAVQVKTTKRPVGKHAWMQLEHAVRRMDRRLSLEGVQGRGPVPVMVTLHPDLDSELPDQKYVAASPQTLAEQLLTRDHRTTAQGAAPWLRDRVLTSLLLVAVVGGAGPQASPTVGHEIEVLDDVWGPEPTSEAVLSGLRHQVRLDFERRRAIGSGSLSRSEIAELLGKSPQAVTGDLEAGRLIGIRDGRHWLIPGWQMAADTPSGVVPGLAELVRAFPAGPVALTEWVLRATPDLDGRTPREALLGGDEDQVLRLARSLHAAAS